MFNTNIRIQLKDHLQKERKDRQLTYLCIKQ